MKRAVIALVATVTLTACTSVRPDVAVMNTWTNDVKPQALAGNELIEDESLRESKLEAIEQFDSFLFNAVGVNNDVTE